MVNNEKSYRQLSEELESIMIELQDESLDIDKALDLHEKAIQLIKGLEKRLGKAKNRFEKLDKE